MAKSLDIIDPKRDMDDDHEDRSDEEPDDEEMKVEKSSGGVFYLILGIIAILVATGAALYILFQDKGDPNKATTSAVQTASPENSATQTVTETVSAEAPTNPSPESTFTYTDQKIRIANGNGINGEAGRIEAILEDKKYVVESTGNASRSYDESIIYYKSGQESLANAIKSDLSGEYAFSTEEADNIVGSYDAVVVLGAK